jgi:hypothetical protein
MYQSDGVIGFFRCAPCFDLKGRKALPPLSINLMHIAFATIIDGENLLFFRGNGASVTRIIPYAALHYSTYEHYRSAIISTLNTSSHPVSVTRPPVWIDLLAGSCSGATAVAITYPLDLVRTRLAWQLETNHGSTVQRLGIAGTLRSIVFEEGFLGLYRVSYLRITLGMSRLCACRHFS